jgi:hypothetical protein
MAYSERGGALPNRPVFAGASSGHRSSAGIEDANSAGRARSGIELALTGESK